MSISNTWLNHHFPQIYSRAAARCEYVQLEMLSLPLEPSLIVLPSSQLTSYVAVAV